MRQQCRFFRVSFLCDQELFHEKVYLSNPIKDFFFFPYRMSDPFAFENEIISSRFTVPYIVTYQLSMVGYLNKENHHSINIEK